LAPVPGDVAIFLGLDHTPADRARIAEVLDSHPAVKAYMFEDRYAVYERFKQTFCDAPELIAATKPDSLPESFRVTLMRPEDVAALRDAIGPLPGVGEVVSR
jgi:cell division transport system permease protein